jgi:flagellar assembly factor FliW
MQLETTHFGTLEISKEQIITFPKGLLGFEGLNRYVVVDREDCRPFRWLQCVDSAELALVVVDPLFFFPDYVVSVHAREVADIGATDPDDVEILVIATIPGELEQMSVNLQGPILVNRTTMLAKQMVLTDSKYTVQHRLLPELRRRQQRQESKITTGSSVT